MGGAPRNDGTTTRPSGTLIAGTATRQGVAVGDVINGKYQVERLLGEGGVGVVAAATNLELDERVALKFLKPEMLASSDMVARFAREAKAACAIKSEHVCTVYDVGTVTGGQPFLVMEYLDGENLDTVVRDRGRFSVRDATEYAMQVCEALAVAHAKGIVHRDIKPENLFLTSRGGLQMVKVLDFGISKTALTGSVFGTALPLVKTMNLMGSPVYMSPEQVRSSDSVDTRTDIWSLGVVIYELLTASLPFGGSTITELTASILERPMGPLASHRTDVPPGYVAIIEKCLEKDRNNRFQNVAELAAALMPFGPKRSRICAERAALALRAAGIVDDAALRFLSTAPPAPSSDSAPDIILPDGASLRHSTTGPLQLSKAPEPSVSTSVAAQGTTTRGRVPVLALAAGAIVFLVLAAIVFFRPTRSGDAANTSARASAAAATSTSSPAAPSETGAVGAAATPSTGAGTGTGSVALTPSVLPTKSSEPLIGTRRAPLPTPALQPRPGPSAQTGRPKNPNKKSSDEADLGY
jgi:serine/threonine-protein kinase